MVLFLRRTRAGPEAQLSIDLLRVPGLRWLGLRWVKATLEAISCCVFILILAACFFGNPSTFDNIAPTFVWVIWWVGLAFLSALIGNFWDLMNPWRILFQWAVRLRSVSPTVPRPYPAWLGYWPAVMLFLAFAWMELISEVAEQPRMLGNLIIFYTLITWFGMARYSCETWLRHGEVFSVVFGVLARFAPLNGIQGELRLRFPATGLLVSDRVPMSYVCFVLLLLTTVTFDGLLETPYWQAFLTWVSENMVLRGTLISLQQAGVDLISLLKTMALVVMPVIFIGVYMVVSWLIGWASGKGGDPCKIAGYFVLSLVPIAIAYHLSHYLSYLLIAGQNIIPLASDPFGIGWDLFGTKSYNIDIGIVNAKMIWYVAVIAIIVGHVFAVYLAHVMALRVFVTARQVLFSQLPMLVLMVAYTMVSLWILSQPIVS